MEAVGSMFVGRLQVGLLGGLAIAMMSAGCQRLPNDAVRQIDQSYQSYLRRDYGGSHRLASAVIQKHDPKPDVAEAYYLRGLCDIQLRKPANARNDMVKALQITDRDELAAWCRAQLGNLEYEAGRYHQAADQYRLAATDLPERPPADKVLHRYAESLQRSGRFGEAKRVYADLLLRFPGSTAATQTRTRGSWARDEFTVQCGVFSKASNARDLAARLKRSGIDARAWEDRRNNRVNYVVRAGNYPNYAAAQAALTTIRRQVPDAFIVP